MGLFNNLFGSSDTNKTIVREPKEVDYDLVYSILENVVSKLNEFFKKRPEALIDDKFEPTYELSDGTISTTYYQDLGAIYAGIAKRKYGIDICDAIVKKLDKKYPLSDNLKEMLPDINIKRMEASIAIVEKEMKDLSRYPNIDLIKEVLKVELNKTYHMMCTTETTEYIMDGFNRFVEVIK